MSTGAKTTKKLELLRLGKRPKLALFSPEKRPDIAVK